MSHHRKTRGFILLETLIALAITAICLELFWEAHRFQVQVDTRLTRDYVEQRLTRDVLILHKLGALDKISADGYAPFEIETVTSEFLDAKGPNDTQILINFLAKQ